MAIKVTLNDITSGHGTADLLNTNFTTIEDEFDNCLSLDGTAPNQMQANLDMNGNAILNASNFNTDFNVRGNWATATAYSVGDVVFVQVSDSATNGGGSYYAQTAHTSGTFDTDLASTYWIQLSERGAAGAAGGLDPANNLSDLSNLTTSLNNLIAAHGALATADIADDAITLDKLAAGTDGELITWDASGDPATVAVGTAGQVLTSNGAGAAPTFQSPSSTAASQAEMEAASSTTVMVTPGRQHYHPSSPKAWVRFGPDGTVASSYNVSSVSRTATGNFTVTMTNALSDTNYCVVAGGSITSAGTVLIGNLNSITSSSEFKLNYRDVNGAAGNPDEGCVVVYGDM